MGTVDTILKMMGMHVSSADLDNIIEEIDEDGSGQLEFPEFIQLAAKFLVEEDEEEMRWELKEAFRLYDKQGTYNLYTPYRTYIIGFVLVDKHFFCYLHCICDFFRLFGAKTSTDAFFTL